MSTDNKELLQLQITLLEEINKTITNLESQPESAKADKEYPKTLAVYTRLKETYEERIAAFNSAATNNNKKK